MASIVPDLLANRLNLLYPLGIEKKGFFHIETLIAGSMKSQAPRVPEKTRPHYVLVKTLRL